MTLTRLLIAGAVLALAAAIVVAARPHQASAEERIDRISAELRCPVCQGLSVRDSPSETAREMRDLVAVRVREGRSDEEIASEFRAAYGDWVMLAPPLLSWSGLVWLAPIAALVVGLALAYARLRRAPPAMATNLDPARVAALRERVAREEAAEG